jgi:peroxiredoxin
LPTGQPKPAAPESQNKGIPLAHTPRSGHTFTLSSDFFELSLLRFGINYDRIRDSLAQMLERVHRMHKNSLTAARRVIIISAMVLAAALVFAGCKKEPANPSSIEPRQTPNHNDNNKPTTGPNANNTQGQPINPHGQPEEPNEDDGRPKISLTDVISAARYWQPSYERWYGKTAPDFTLTDFNGKEHKLSDYRGKDVMLVFFATWCRPCLYEIPHLIELRRSISEDKLAILAISYEDPRMVKEIAAQVKMNYTILFEKNNMPNPFGVLRIFRTSGIPCSFFIKPDGKIKLATSGILQLTDMNAILQAE